MNYYTKADAERAIRNAEEAIKFCKSKIPKIDYDGIINYLELCERCPEERREANHTLWISCGRRLYGDIRCGHLDNPNKFKDIRIIDRMLDFLDPSLQ